MDFAHVSSCNSLSVNRFSQIYDTQESVDAVWYACGIGVNRRQLYDKLVLELVQYLRRTNDVWT